MSSFQDLGFFRSHYNPEADAQWGYAHATFNYKTERKHLRTSFGLLHQGYCEQKTTKS